jgi:hypothetical protein
MPFLIDIQNEMLYLVLLPFLLPYFSFKVYFLTEKILLFLYKVCIGMDFTGWRTCKSSYHSSPLLPPRSRTTR